VTYSSCPRCGIRIRTRKGITPVHCARCLGRSGARVELVRSYLAASEARGRPRGLKPTPQPEG
jgi:hypothetical protein